MITFDFRLKCLVTLSERVQGFLDDGYIVVFNANLGDIVCYKLRHCNGNIIWLKLDIENGTLCQTTNGVEVHNETLR